MWTVCKYLHPTFSLQNSITKSIWNKKRTYWVHMQAYFAICQYNIINWQHVQHNLDSALNINLTFLSVDHLLN